MTDDELEQATIIRSALVRSGVWVSDRNGEKAVKALMQLFQTALTKWEAEERTNAQAERFDSYLKKLDQTEAIHLLAVTAYLYVMEPTNASSFKTKIREFSRHGKVLGDMHISARLVHPIKRDA
jgi:hypothetical protein